MISQSSSRLAHLLTMLAIAGCGESTTAPQPGDPDPAPSPASLVVQVEGLPSGLTASVSVAGVGGFSASITGTQTLTGLAPGTYTITTADVPSGDDAYEPEERTQSVTLAAGQTTTISVIYRMAERGILRVTVAGLPSHLLSEVWVRNGGTLNERIIGTEELRLPPGDYSIEAGTVTQDIYVHVPDEPNQTVTISADATTVAVVKYDLVLASLSISIAGLPDGMDPAVVVDGPAGYQVTLTATTTLADINPGEYTLTASSVEEGPDHYSPAPPTQSLTVASGGAGTMEVAYSRFTLAAEAIKHIASGGLYSCALDSAGAVKCWGARDADGTFGWDYDDPAGPGYTATEGVAEPTPIVGQNVPPFVQLAIGKAHQCGLTVEGQAWCWGHNSFGQVGDGTVDRKLQPAPVAGGIVFGEIAADGNMTCGLTVSGQAYCWGENIAGSIGDGERVHRTLPSLVTGNHVFTQIVVGLEHACALDDGGLIWCWGSNRKGQLGQGAGDSNGPNPNPLLVDNTPWARLSDAASLHQCALKSSGDAYCWGENGLNQLGMRGLDFRERTRPFLVPGGHKFRDIVAGGSHTCGVDGAGQLWCWGGNSAGQLATGDTGRRTEPEPAVQGSLVFSRLVSGPGVTCGIAEQDELYCWGYNYLGAVGDGTFQDKLVPTRVLPIG